MHVANSSISVDVSAANSKLARMLRKREEDEAILQIGKRKVRDNANQDGGGRSGSRGKTSKWSLKPDFSYPTPMVDRPRTTSGSTSFHFSYTTVSKQGAPTVAGAPLSGVGPKSSSPGADHSKYIERDGAAERSAGAEHAAYIERPQAVELLDPAAIIAEVNERMLSEIVNETPTETEAEMLGFEEDIKGIPSIFSNISLNQFEREEYWRAVHRSERDPQMHQVIPDPEANPGWWDAMPTSPEMHEPFRAHCLLVQEKYVQWRAAEEKAPSGKPFSGDPWIATPEGCGKAIVGARLVPGWNEIDPAIEFKSGPGGRVQFRFVAELPHEIIAEDRALIVQNFCDHLETFSRDEAGRSQGMMYTAVIHAPDANNDRRNYHLHIIAHDRPAKWLDDKGMWDFEVVEDFNHNGNMRQRYPFRQNKIGEVTRKLNPSKRHANYDNANAGADFIPGMRRKYAQITNAVLEARGIERRLDPRRYEEMGIARTPTEHLGTKAAALEAIGVPTIIGKLNAIAIWNDAEKAIDARSDAVNRELKNQQGILRDLSEEAQSAIPSDPALRALRTLMAERELLLANVADDRRVLMTFDHLEAKAKSRAIRTRQTCLQLLTQIQKGTADRWTKVAARTIRGRWQEAQDWIDAIDRDLAPDRAMLTRSAGNVREREERIKQIDLLVAPLRAKLLANITASLPEREQRRLETHYRKIAADYAAAQEQAAKEAKAAKAAKQKEPANSNQPATPATASLDQIMMDGMPIVSPTINPKATPIAAPPAQPAHGATPVGLSPLRPQEPSPEHVEPADRTIIDIVPSVVDPAVVERAPEHTKSPIIEIPATDLQPDGTSLIQPAVEGLSDKPVAADPQAIAALPNSPAPRVTNVLASDNGPATPSPLPGLMTVPDETAQPAVSVAAPGASPEAESVVSGVTGQQPSQSPPAAAPEAISEAPAPEVDGPPRDSDPTSDPALPTQPIGRTGAPGPSPSVASDVAGVTSPQTSIAPPAVLQEANSTAPTQKVDGRRRDSDPTLFPLPDARAPIKPGTTEAAYEVWDNLMKRIATDRIAIIRVAAKSGGFTYSVPSIDPKAQAVLKLSRFAGRTDVRLPAIYENQIREVGRLIRWIETNGQDAERLVLIGNTATIGKAPQSVRKLLHDWRAHPDVGDALRAENQRRIEATQETALAASRQVRPPVVDTATRDEATARLLRIAEAELIYPKPESARTRQVYLLLQLLRTDAPAEQLQEAADAVKNDDVAREDVHRHRVELSIAYNTFVEDDEVRLTRERDGRGGR